MVIFPSLLTLWILVAETHVFVKSQCLVPATSSGDFFLYDPLTRVKQNKVSGGEFVDVGSIITQQCMTGYKVVGVNMSMCLSPDIWLPEPKYLDCLDKNEYNANRKLYQAAKYGNLDEIKRLAQKGVDLSEKVDGSTAIHVASENGHLDVVKYLISLDPTLAFERDFVAGAWPLHYAAFAGNLDVLQYFIDHLNMDIQATDTKFDLCPLHYASKGGHLDVTKWLVDRGADVAAKANDIFHRETPIHLATIFSRLPLVKYFIEQVDSNMAYWKDLHSETPLHLAAMDGNISIVSYFISERQMDIETKNEESGQTVLHKASDKGHLDLVKWLVAQGANVNALSNGSLRTPVHLAAGNGHTEVVKYFIENFPHLRTVKDKLGNTILQLVESKNNPDFIELLEYLKGL